MAAAYKTPALSRPLGTACERPRLRREPGPLRWREARGWLKQTRTEAKLRAKWARGNSAETGTCHHRSLCPAGTREDSRPARPRRGRANPRTPAQSSAGSWRLEQFTLHRTDVGQLQKRNPWERPGSRPASAGERRSERGPSHRSVRKARADGTARSPRGSEPRQPLAGHVPLHAPFL